MAIIEYEEELKRKFSERFNRPRKTEGFKYNIHFEDNLKIFQQKRKIPKNLLNLSREAVKNELHQITANRAH